VVQAAIFALFVFVIVRADPLVTQGWPAEIFPRLSPLSLLLDVGKVFGYLYTTVSDHVTALLPASQHLDLPTIAALARLIVELLGLLILALILALGWASLQGARGKALWGRAVVSLIPMALLPLIIFGAVMASTYWPALLALLLAILLGRFFCAWVCPLGTTIDITDWALTRRRGKRPATERIYDGRRFKYYLLAFLILCAILGVQIMGWFDPLSIAPRTYAIVIHPYLVGGINLLFNGLQNFPLAGPYLAQIHTALKTLLFAVQQPTHQGHFGFLIIFLVIILMGLYYRRYWCRNLCPLGALFALVSDWAIFKRSVTDACIKCLKCHRDCRMGAIDDTGRGTLDGECIECMDCQRICPVNAIRFAQRPPQEECVAVDLSKRAFVTSCAAGLVAVPALRLNFPKHLAQGRLTIIRPPGALPEQEFLLRCVRCGECMRICRTQGLHPTTFEAGLEGMWTPQLIPRIGYCDYQCTLCGHVCPSGAIQPLTPEVKHKIAIGKAHFDKNRCIPWVGHARLDDLKKNWEDVNCGTCEEVCPVPTKAIRYQHIQVDVGKELRVPYIKEELCNGCGYCVKVCPVRGQAAVYVDGARDRAVVVESAPQSNVSDFFPETIGEWRRVKDPVEYVGKQRLFDLIDGGAEPYLTYSFKQIVDALYVSAGQETDTVDVRIWEFEVPSDAYGVFTKDHPGGPSLPIGDAAASGENQVCVWRDKYYITVEPRGGKVDADALRKIAQAVVDCIKAPKGVLPPIIGLLPAEGQVQGSIKFFSSKLMLDNIYLTENAIEENIFLLDDDPQAKNRPLAVTASYTQAGAEAPFVFMLIQYPSASGPLAAQKALLDLRAKWHETVQPPAPSKAEGPAGGITTTIDGNGLASTVAVKGRYLVGAFRCKDRKAAEAMTQAVLAKLK
jgi:polyferredoxin